MKKSLLLIKMKFDFFLWLWKLVKIEEGTKPGGKRAYFAKLTDANDVEIVTYDAITKDVYHISHADVFLVERALKKFAKNGNGAQAVAEQLIGLSL